MARFTSLILALSLAIGCGDKESDDSGGADGTTDGTDGADGADGADGTDGTSGVDGAEVYGRTCGNCHGANGNDGFATDLTMVVPSLSDEELQSVITEGKGNMQPVDLDADEVAAVITYLRATFN